MALHRSILIAVLALALGASTAQAQDQFYPHSVTVIQNPIAGAAWRVGGDTPWIEAHLWVTDRGDLAAQRGSVNLTGAGTWIDLTISQQYCDEATDTLIFRELRTDGALGSNFVHVDRTLDAGEADGVVFLDGDEYHFDDCDDPTLVSTAWLQDVRANVDASWEAAGDQRLGGPSITPGDIGGCTLDTHLARSRNAVATGTISFEDAPPRLELGELAPTTRALLAETTRTFVRTGSGSCP